MTNAFLEIPQTINFTHHGLVRHTEVAEALLSLDRIARRQIMALDRLTTQWSIETADVYLDRLQSGSLLHDYFVRIFFKDKEGEDRFIAWMRTKTGMDKSKMKVLLGIVGAAALGAGAYWAVQRFGGSTPGAVTTVNAWNNTVIQIGAGEFDMSEDTFRLLIDRSIPAKKAHARDVVKLLGPARHGTTGGDVTINGIDALTIPAAVVDAVPTPAMLTDEPDEERTTYTNVDIFLRATNLDSGTTGWAAQVPDIAERRVKLALEGVTTEAVFGRRRLKGDIVAIERVRPDGRRALIGYSLIRVEPE